MHLPTCSRRGFLSGIGSGAAAGFIPSVHAAPVLIEVPDGATLDLWQVRTI